MFIFQTLGEFRLKAQRLPETRTDHRIYRKSEESRKQRRGWPCCPAAVSGVEVLGVVLDVIVHEGVDEEVAVVVALQDETQRQRQKVSKCLF